MTERYTIDGSAVTLCCAGDTLRLAAELRDLRDLFSASWLQTQHVAFGAPMTETATFDFARGSVTLGIEAAGSVLAAREITLQPYAWRGGALLRLLGEDEALPRAVQAAFARFGANVAEEPQPAQYVAATYFHGYDERFYETIPFPLEEEALPDEALLARAEPLRDARALPALYARSALPQMKSVRRAMFTDPGLFFYLRECEQVWSLLPDPNLFCRFLRSDAAYEMLLQLQTFPACVEALRVLCAGYPAHDVYLMLTDAPEAVISAACSYLAANAGVRRRMFTQWQSTRMPWRERSLPECSVPVRSDTWLRTDRIGQFRFRRLRSTGEFVAAGIALNNCLGEMAGACVYVVCCNSALRAAIEIVSGAITQAYLADNEALSDDPELYEAVGMWARLNGLVGF